LALKLRPSALGSGIDKDRADYAVYCETRGGPDSLRWLWSLTVNGPMTRARTVRRPWSKPKRSFGKAGTLWKGWAKLEAID
jgi:hypothetical protein